MTKNDTTNETTQIDVKENEAREIKGGFNPQPEPPATRFGAPRVRFSFRGFTR